MKRATQRRNIVLQRMADEALHHAGAGGRREAEADRHARPAEPAARASRRSSSRRCASTSSASTAPRCCTRTASSVTTTLDRDAAGTRQPRDRARPARVRQAPRLAARRRATCSTSATRSTASRTNAGHARSRSATSFRPSSSPRRRRGAARLRVGPYHADLDRAGYAWTRRTSAADLFKPGDLVDVAVTKIDDGAGARDGARWSRRRSPKRALVAIDNRTGQIKAMVGGWSFSAEQVQPRGSGVPAARIDVQADRLHRGDRSRLHAGLDPHRRAGELSRPATGRSTARTTTITSSRGRSRCAGRSRSRATSRRSR